MTIWKFPLKITDEQVIEMPYPAHPLSVQVQGDQPCLWALVDPKAKTCGVRVWTIGTGNPIDKGHNLGRFIGTYQLPDRSLVFHAFASPARCAR